MYKRGIIYLDENQCPKCKGILELASIERSLIQVNKDGLPLIDDNIDDEIEVYFVCKDCKAKYEADKIGMYFKVKNTLPKINKPLKDLNPFSIYSDYKPV